MSDTHALCWAGFTVQNEPGVYFLANGIVRRDGRAGPPVSIWKRRLSLPQLEPGCGLTSCREMAGQNTVCIL